MDSPRNEKVDVACKLTAAAGDLNSEQFILFVDKMTFLVAKVFCYANGIKPNPKGETQAPVARTLMDADVSLS